MKRSLLTLPFCGIAIAALCGAAAGQSATPLEDAVRAATIKYKDPAVAVAAGYVAMPCVSGPAGGAMGIHYANPPLLEDNVIDANKPEVLMYEPLADGSLALLGVEYITFSGPAVLMGHLFHFTNAPNRYGLDSFYELHVWAWRHNPDGTFADFNPSVACSAMNDTGQGMHGH